MDAFFILRFKIYVQTILPLVEKIYCKTVINNTFKIDKVPKITFILHNMFRQYVQTISLHNMFKVHKYTNKIKLKRTET